MFTIKKNDVAQPINDQHSTQMGSYNGNFHNLSRYRFDEVTSIWSQMEGALYDLKTSKPFIICE